jgi:Leucine-rich repeat (LRR) protein
MKKNAPNTLLDSESLEKEPVFRSLEEALQTPLKVYKLDLSRNQLKTLPEEMAEMKNLQYLYLGENPISDEEEENIKELLPECHIYFF